MKEQGSETGLDILLRAAFEEYEDTDAGIIRSCESGGVKIPHRTDAVIKRRIRRYFSCKDERELSHGHRKTVITLVAAAIIAAMLCLSVNGIIAERVAVEKTEYDVYDQYDYSFEGKHETAVFFEPSYVAKGLTREVRMKAKGALIVDYCLDGEPVVTYSQYVESSASFAIDNEHTTKKSVKIKRLEGTLFTFDDGTMLLNWTDGEDLYELDNRAPEMISEKKLIKMAKSLKKAKE